jgi:hypothetical protein
MAWWSGRAGGPDAYRRSSSAARAAGQVFACACTRKEIADSALVCDGTRRYPGTCRNGLPPGREARAWRLRGEPGVVSFDDAVQGLIYEDVAADVGDFVLLRADGLFAYRWRWWWMTPRRVSPRSCGPTCSTPLPGRYCCSACLAIPRRPIYLPVARAGKSLRQPLPGQSTAATRPGCWWMRSTFGQQPPAGSPTRAWQPCGRGPGSAGRWPVPRWWAVPAPLLR